MGNHPPYSQHHMHLQHSHHQHQETESELDKLWDEQFYHSLGYEPGDTSSMPKEELHIIQRVCVPRKTSFAFHIKGLKRPKLQEEVLIFGNRYKQFYGLLFHIIFMTKLEDVMRIIVKFWEECQIFSQLFIIKEVKELILSTDAQVMGELADLIMKNPLGWKVEKTRSLLNLLRHVLPLGYQMAGIHFLPTDFFQKRLSIVNDFCKTLKKRAEMVSSAKQQQYLPPTPSVPFENINWQGRG